MVAKVEVDGERHLVKLSRYHDNQQFWTVPGERDERLQGRKTVTVTELPIRTHMVGNLH